MLKNYIKIAWRNLLKHKLDSAISIGGLSVGIACCLLLVAYVRYEWSVDKFHTNSSQIHLVYKQTSDLSGNEKGVDYLSGYQLASAIKSGFPDVQNVTRWETGILEVKIHDSFYGQIFGLTEPGFFKLFNFPLIAGAPETALLNPNSIVITREMALQFFGNEQIIGKTIMLRHNDKKEPFTVTGILADIPYNSSFQFDYLIPVENSLLPDNWNLRTFETYVMLKKNVVRDLFEEKLQKAVDDYWSGSIQVNTDRKEKLRLLPFQDVYFTVKGIGIIKQVSYPIYSWILLCLALVILCIAAFNFMNLTLSRVTARSDEITLRKVVGVSRGELAIQFLGEAFLICTLAFLLGALLAELVMPWFVQLINKPVYLGLLNDPIAWGMFVGLLLFATLVTGGYPAWALSRKRLLTGFNARTFSQKVPGFVKGMAVAQFTLAIVFLSCVFIMYSQMRYISNKDLGFNPENVVQISWNPKNPEKSKRIFNTYTQEAQRIPGVVSVTGMANSFGLYTSSVASWSDELPRMIYIYRSH